MSISDIRPIDSTIARAIDNEYHASGKVMGLSEAVRQYIEPGMKLHLAGDLGGPSAAICEIIRQFWNKDPRFELIQCILSGHVMNLIHGKLAEKLIFTVCAGSGKSRIEIQQAFAQKTIAFENWSLATLQQRLMAGAFGFSFMPTRSIVGSSMAVENKDTFREIKDPFESGEKVGLVKALNPDISIVHGCVADVFGNTILPAPYSDDVWGPMASRNGVIVTVERIVPTEFIQQHAALVKLPAHIVKAVCVAPMGVHPFSLTNPGIGEFDTYGMDGEFLMGLTKATAEDQLDPWIENWILDCPNHEAYLKKLGGKRLNSLRGKSSPAVWDVREAYPSPPPAVDDQYNPDEMMAISASREIIKSVTAAGHKTMLAGAGAGLLASWLAYFQLRAQGYDISLIQGNGKIGYLPQPGESALRSGSVLPSAKMLSDAITTHGVFVGGRHNRCISLLGAGEIDKYGNINSTLTSDGLFLSGSGGGNDAANASEVMIVLQQSNRRFVDRLAFVTCPGDRVAKVVSSMGVFRKPPGVKELYLCSCFPDADQTPLDRRIAIIKENCGWDVRTTDTVADVPRPSMEELQLLRSLLPAAMV